jgi:hypothetical protein
VTLTLDIFGLKCCSSAFFTPPLRTICPIVLIDLGVVVLIIFGEEKLSFLQSLPWCLHFLIGEPDSSFELNLLHRTDYNLRTAPACSISFKSDGASFSASIAKFSVNNKLYYPPSNIPSCVPRNIIMQKLYCFHCNR